MQQQAIDDLKRTLLDVFVRAMDRVARLEADDGAPAALGKGGTCLGGSEAVGIVHNRLCREYRHGAGDECVALGVDGGDAGVGFVLGAVDLARFAPLVVAIDIMHLEDSAYGSLG